MFDSILIANRGEIAVRIARTAKRMGLRVIAVYSEADRAAPHVAHADEAYCIGPAPAAQSYLDAGAILEAARHSEAQCLHPGYGFLAENAEFAALCAKNGIVFVGPSPEAIRAMGLKSTAKTLMQKAGVPVVPGYHGEAQDDAVLGEEAIKIGFPVLIKPSAGGGGKGMRLVLGVGELGEAINAARREARASFGDDRLLVEKYIETPRHIEIQILGDTHGNVVHLFERDCSAQRRHQKVIEESPAPGMRPETREAMIRAAIEAAKSVNYAGAGTVEFIAEGGAELVPDGFWFLEMNTRLQVEHPVSEMVTGLDLVEWQLRIAAGETLPSRLSSLKAEGHAIEARLYAEDPATGFLPSTGKLVRLDFATGAEHTRIDAGVDEGGAVTPYYDPMIAKLIAWGQSRKEAILRLDKLISQTLVAGVKTNAAFLRRLITHDDFLAGGIDTGFIERHLSELTAPDMALKNRLVRAGAVFEILRCCPEPGSSPWSATDGWQLGGERRIGLELDVDGEEVQASALWREGKCEVELPGDAPDPGTDAPPVNLIRAASGVFAASQGLVVHVALAQETLADEAQGAGEGRITAPMPGKILSIDLTEGQSVNAGATLVILEAMKMEHSLKAPFDAKVLKVNVNTDDQVEDGVVLIVLEHAEKKE